MPPPPEKAPSNFASEESFFDSKQAHVPKFTEVKEGQEHPVGKNNQYKLFHEHVWPKGYTPTRLAEVRDNMPRVVNSPNSGFAPGEGTAKLTDHIARSTIPVEDLQGLNNNQFEITLGTTVDNAGGFFTSEGMPHKGINPGVVLPKKQVPKPGLPKDRDKKARGYAKTLLNHTVVHEIGHAVDFASRPSTYNVEQRSIYNETIPARPRAEGIAEGYRSAHTRVTRAMRRSKKQTPVGYRTDKWDKPLDQLTYKVNRQGTYNDQIKRIQ